MMSTDLETDPNKAKDLIRESKKRPDAIVTGSRWLRGGGFEGYNPVKLVLNYIFQKLFSFIFGVNLTDMTYGYRIIPTNIANSIHWEELKHPFLFETLVKPIRLGVEVIEIPMKWKARSSGESQNTFLRNFGYFKTGMKVFFYTKKMIRKEGN